MITSNFHGNWFEHPKAFFFLMLMLMLMAVIVICHTKSLYSYKRLNSIWFGLETDFFALRLTKSHWNPADQVQLNVLSDIFAYSVQLIRRECYNSNCTAHSIESSSLYLFRFFCNRCRRCRCRSYTLSLRLCVVVDSKL